MVHSSQRTEHSRRDDQIIHHVARYRLTTNQVVRRLVFPDQQTNAVAKVTARLCTQRLLSGYTLYHPRRYFTLGPLAARNLGLPLYRTHPLGPQSLPTEYAVLAYALMGRNPRTRLTAAEIDQQYPWLSSTSKNSLYCHDLTVSPSVLELVRADLGGTPDHVARKCDADIQVCLGFSEFEQLVRASRFRMVVLTGTIEKSAAVRAAMGRHLWPDGLQIHLAVVPDLLLLTGSLYDGS